MIAVIVLLAIVTAGVLFLCAISVVAWLKIRTYLLWNTRYQGADYEAAIKTPKVVKPVMEPRITEKRGRNLVPVDDLVDLADIGFEEGYDAIVKAAE